MNKTKIIVTAVLLVLLVGALVFVTRTPNTPVPASMVTENDNNVIESTSTTENINNAVDTETLHSSTTNQTTESIVVTNIPEGWKTYANDEKRFGFAYPANWDINLNWKDNLKNRNDAEQFGHVRVIGDGYQFGVTYLENENDTDLFGYVDISGDGYLLTVTSLEHGFGRDAVIQKTVSDIYISGKKAKAWETSFSREIKLLVVVPSCNNLSFFIENFTSSTSSDLLYQIISTAVCE